jgi:hypothetical protein
MNALPWLYKLVVIAVVIAVPLYAAYNRGYENATAKAEAERAEAERKTREEVSRIQNMNAETIANYVGQIESLTEQHKHDLEALENAKYADAIQVNHDNDRDNVNVTCDRVRNEGSSDRVPKTQVKQNLLCYTESELRRKVAASLDIANECDKLAVRYNSLLESCTATSTRP